MLLDTNKICKTAYEGKLSAHFTHSFPPCIMYSNARPSKAFLSILI